MNFYSFLADSTLKHFMKKVEVLMRRVPGSNSWERIAHEIRNVLLMQIAYLCDDNLLAACASNLSPKTRAQLYEVIRQRYETATQNVRDARITLKFETTIFKDLEVCWYTRRLASFFEWPEVLAQENLTGEDTEIVLLPHLQALNEIDMSIIASDVKSRQRNFPPKPQWWYHEINWPLTHQEKRRARHSRPPLYGSDSLGRVYTMPPLPEAGDRRSGTIVV